jgi:hypothetical protein
MADVTTLAVEHEPRCTSCFAPATHRGPGELLCGPCARRRSAHEAGEAFAALAILPAVLDALRTAGASDLEILNATTSALALDIDVEFPCAEGPGWAFGTFERDTRYVPLADPEGGE